jgi:predicted dehydrogenase
MRYLPQVLAARTLIREGGLGRLMGMKIAEHLYREMSYWHGGTTGRSRSNWRASREQSGGGVLLMNVSHHLDALLFITGLQTRRVYCELDRFAAPGDVEDLAALTVRMTDGSIASIDASTCAPGGGERAFQVWGSEGQLALDDPPRYLSLRTSSLGQTNEWRHLPIGGEREARRDFVRAFAAAVRGREPNPVPPGESIAVQELIDAAYDSARRGGPVEVGGTAEKAADVVSGA